MSLSALCVAHCLLVAVMLSATAVATSVLTGSHIHEIGLMLALPLAGVSLGRGITRHGLFTPASIGGLGLGMMGGALTLPHGSPEVIYTVIGVLLVAAAHYLNRRALV